jgi:hypothetical protein
LVTEKRVYFGIQIGAWALIIIMVMFAAPAFGSDFGVTLFVALFIAALSVLIVWFVLYGAQTWAKWTCMGCTGFSLLGSVGSLFAPAHFAATQGGAPVAYTLISSLVSIAMGLWLISILWRDVQAQRGY